MGILDYLTELMDHLWDRMGCLTIPMEDMDTVMDTVMDTITDSSLTFFSCIWGANTNIKTQSS